MLSLLEPVRRGIGIAAMLKDLGFKANDCS